MRTIGLLGRARAPVHHDRLQDAELALATPGLPRFDLNAADLGQRPALDRSVMPARRMVRFQVMPVSEGIQRIIMRRGDAPEIAEQAHIEGVGDPRPAGPLEVKQGLGSLEMTMTATNE